MDSKSKGRKGPSWHHRAKIRIRKAMGANVFLCHKCKWDWRGACHNPNRPNVTWCDDYAERGK
ncbi:MAG: hypothetical protein SVY53_10775 [Chloroflexota bacterium]|nr:hypothetical protein [Chloroflexota bacterium]